MHPPGTAQRCDATAGGDGGQGQRAARLPVLGIPLSLYENDWRQGRVDDLVRTYRPDPGPIGGVRYPCRLDMVTRHAEISCA